MAFKTVKAFDPHGAPILLSRIIADDVVITELDSMKIDTSGFCALGTTGATVFGHVIGIQTDLGVGLETTGVAGAQSGSFIGTHTVSSTNETVNKVRAVCDVSKTALYSAELDAAIGTNNSDLAGHYLDLSDEDTLSESSVGTTAAQYATHGVDPNNSAQPLVNIFESSVFGPLA